MKFKFQHLEKIIGSFVILSLLTILFAVIAVGRGQQWFVKNYPYFAVFNGDAGLKPGSAVQMMGIDIGEVTSVALNEHNQIEVHFKVQEKYIEKIRSDSVARSASPSLLGGKVLDITVGSTLLSAVEPDSEIPSEEGGGLSELIQSGRLESILAKVDAIVHHVRQLSETLVSASENLDLTLQNLAALTDRIREGEGSVGKLLSDKDELYRELYTALQNTRESLENLKATTDEIRQVSPEAKRLVERSEESLVEAQRVIKALQQTWPLSGKIPQSPEKINIQLDTREDLYPKRVTSP